MDFDKNYEFKKWYYVIPFALIHIMSLLLIAVPLVFVTWYLAGQLFYYENTSDNLLLFGSMVFFVVVPICIFNYWFANKVAMKYWLIPKEGSHSFSSVGGTALD